MMSAVTEKHLEQAGVAQSMHPMDRDAWYTLLWLIWTVILAAGIAYALFSVGAFSWP